MHLEASSSRHPRRVVRYRRGIAGPASRSTSRCTWQTASGCSITGAAAARNGRVSNFLARQVPQPADPRDRQHQQRRRPAGRAKPHRTPGDQAGRDRAHDDRRARLRTRRAAGERDRSRHHGHRHDRRIALALREIHRGPRPEDLDRLTQSEKLSTRMTPRTLIYARSPSSTTARCSSAPARASEPRSRYSQRSEGCALYCVRT